MAEDTQETVSACDSAKSAGPETETGGENFNSYGDTRNGHQNRSTRTRNDCNNHKETASNRSKTTSNDNVSNNSGGGSFARVHQRARAVLITTVLSAVLSLATFVASLRLSDSPVGIVASILECVVAAGVCGVGLFGTFYKDTAFLALYSVFGACMAVVQALWVVLGSYSIYQLIASLQATRDDEQVAMLKKHLHSSQLYVAAAALSIAGYSLATFFAWKLRAVYQEDPDSATNRSRKGKGELAMNEDAGKETRHATVAVASPFA